VVAARNRALALDQHYLKLLEPDLPQTVIGINQVDLIDPLDWNERLNLPSRVQEARMAEIAADRQGKLGRIVGGNVTVVAYSALRCYNLQKLFAACVASAPPARRWMFEVLKSFSTHDWLARAKGLTPEQRAAMARQHIKADQTLDLHQLGALLQKS
jgi:hypothetical protein